MEQRQENEEEEEAVAHAYVVLQAVVPGRSTCCTKEGLTVRKGCGRVVRKGCGSVGVALTVETGSDAVGVVPPKCTKGRASTGVVLTF